MHDRVIAESIFLKIILNMFIIFFGKIKLINLSINKRGIAIIKPNKNPEFVINCLFSFFSNFGFITLNGYI